ncbi:MULTISPECIES: hypothetical protein [Streptomyces]|uniref:UL36 very large tegument protein n=1 Tax=Streptomyces canarius TaxID=285453 RepID=A0ABQ3D8Q0_9ACTN|nr:hypothetical protein [Streptomyces canarius]GHA62524.1 hypothetical protein GCM10010345_78240 [Streptomyces canarius]
MAVDQLPGQVREFASYLDALLARLDPRGGWTGVFWQRDPEGMRACLDGREVAPWDVVEALLEDLGALYGPAAAGVERERARALHAAAVTAYDTRPGARDALADRLDVMLREQRYAAERHAGLSRRLSTPLPGDQADALRLDLAWAHDDHTRATSRCAELRARLEALDRRTGSAGGRPGPTRPGVAPAPHVAVRPSRTDPPAAPRPRAALAPEEARHGVALPASASGVTAPDVPASPAAAGAEAGGASSPGATPAHTPDPKARRRRRGSARFAGAVEGAEAAPVVVPRASGGAVADGGPRSPRGARFAGAGEVAEPSVPDGAAVDEGAREAVDGVVGRLARLRGEGRGGEAHVVLVEAARWPVGRLPLLADALHRAGLGADWATLLWEAAALPAERLVAAADALTAAGRDGDGRRLLRQGVARPAEKIGAAVLRMEDEGRRREARALLDAHVRVRTPEEAARCVAADPGRLVPLLLDAALGVSGERHRDLVHALRVAGYTV